MRLYAECCEDVNKCCDFSGMVYHHALIKVLNKKKQKLKAKLWLTKGITNSVNNINLMFKFCNKRQTKNLFHLKMLEIYLIEL